MSRDLASAWPCTRLPLVILLIAAAAAAAAAAGVQERRSRVCGSCLRWFCTLFCSFCMLLISQQISPFVPCLQKCMLTVKHCMVSFSFIIMTWANRTKCSLPTRATYVLQLLITWANGTKCSLPTRATYVL